MNNKQHAKMLELAKQTNTAPVYDAFKLQRPVSAVVVDAYNIPLPSGYVLKKGFPRDQYIYKATMQAGWDEIEGVEITEEYLPIAQARVDYWQRKEKQMEMELE